ncbi:hypothetical protein ACFYXQ_38970 [Nocardia jiangxiensis]|uniref:Uncharacterized protein n=1 Tax=Nocardia jiangxiensis TaxID=282685 RepID=A0ABW6SF35_9NOCA
MTEFKISVTESDDDVEELRALYSELLGDGELRTARKSLAPGRGHADTMGFEDVARLVLDNPALDTAFSTCVTAWLTTRGRRKLKIVLRANGTAEIDATGVREITATDVIEALNVARNGSDGPAS